MNECAEDIINIDIGKFDASVCWGNSNELMIYATKQNESNDSTPLKLNNDTAKLHNVKWNNDIYSSEMRKILNEFYGIYLKVQELHKEKDKTEISMFLKASHNYRSVLRANIESMRFVINFNDIENEQIELKNSLKLVEIIELIWHLIEALHLLPKSNAGIVSAYQNWVCTHFMEPLTWANKIIADGLNENDDCYWKSVYALTMQGRLQIVSRLLSYHSSSGNFSFKTMINLINSMPERDIIHCNPKEFEENWLQWKSQVSNVLQQGELASSNELEHLAMIMIGDDSTLKSVSNISETWYGYILTILLYKHPLCKAKELKLFVQDSIDIFGGPDELENYDHILVAIMELDILKALKLCSSLLSNWWFPVHMANLLNCSGCLEKGNIKYGDNLVEFLTLDYAASLFSHKSLWQIGVSYLDQCSVYGKRHLQCYLENMFIENEFKARKIIRILRDRNLDDSVEIICRIFCTKSLKVNRFGNALNWALECNNVKLTGLIADRIMNIYEETGKFPAQQVLSNLGRRMLICNELTFLGKYYEFHDLYTNVEQHGQCISLIVQLLVSGITYRRYWFTLVKDLIPILKGNHVNATPFETKQLIKFCSELRLDYLMETGSFDYKKYFANLEINQLKILKDTHQLILDELNNLLLEYNVNCLETFPNNNVQIMESS